MVEYRLRTPVSEKDIRRLKVGDVVYITGDIVTARDSAHRRALEYHAEGKELPINFAGKPLYHCGPLVREVDGKYEVVSAGPTTSMRMERVEDEFIEAFRVPVIIGKGGMGRRTVEAMRQFGAVYGAVTGGAGALAAKAIKRVKAVEWLDLGMPEALWMFEVEGFGPLIVAMDAHGNSLYTDVVKQVEKNKEQVYKRIHLGTSTSIP